jgi:hypothetical protein
VNKLVLAIRLFFLSFEQSWLSDDGFHDMIKTEWGAVVRGNIPIEIWQNFRRF